MLSSQVFQILFSAVFCFAQDAIIFDPPQTTPAPIQIKTFGYKKLPPGEALNTWALNMQAGAFESTGSRIRKAEVKNIYLAFAVERRYERECNGMKKTVICSFLRSSIRISGSLTWNEARSTDRYEVVLIPIERINGTFGKQGPDLKTTSSALFTSYGAIAEYLRDLGLGVEHRVLVALNGSANYSSAQQPLGEKLAFRWIGSVRAFLGESSTAVNAAGQSERMRGGFTAGIDAQIGLALDLEKGSVSFADSTRHEGDWNFAGASPNLTINTNRVEIKYLHSVCRPKEQGGCSSPRPVNFGGGIRYEYSSASFESGITADLSLHRLILFGELARF